MPTSYPKTSRRSTRPKSLPKAPPRRIPPPAETKPSDELHTRFFAWFDDKDAEGEELEAAASDRLGLRRCWIDMAGDHAGGTMLAQIVYWCLMPSKKTGETKLTIEKHGSKWLAKSDRDWWEECRLSRSQVDRILKQFRDVGWIDTKVMRFNGSPTTHIRVLWSLLHSWKAAVDNPSEFTGK